MIEIEGLSHSLGGQRVLNGIDLSIPARAFVALVGPSGSGKTTLLKTINRLVEPDRGTIRIEGREISAEPAPLLRRRIGYAIQQVGLFPHLTVAENIWMAPRLTGAPAAERDARVAELLHLVALPAAMAERMPRSLSGGQAQRVGLARALAAGPKLMLMDEPFGALDPVTRDELGRAYRGLHDELALTTIMVTHDLSEALLLADRILVLIDGVIRADGEPEDLIGHADPEVRALIDVPRRQAERLVALGTGA